ncbi:MYLK2 kinase, partial [Nyctibius bracteatus]|nr:MYLK2 kinase [Nyctibius bracteatus]
MEQGGGAGGVPGAGRAGGTAPPGAEDSTAPAAPQAAQPHGEQAAPTEGTVTAATGAQDGGKDEPGQEKAPADATARDRGQAEPKQEAGAGEPGGGKAELAEEASATQRDGGQAAPAEGKVPVAPEAQHGEKDVKDEPGKEKAPAGGEPHGAAPREGKVPAAAEAQDRGKDEPMKGQTPGGSGAGGGGKAEPTEEKAPAAAEAEGGKAKPAGEAASAGARAQDGGKEELTKEKTPAAGEEKVPAAAKAQDGGKKPAKAEKAPADKKPAKEKAGASAQDGGKKAAKVEKPPVASKAQAGGKEEPVKEKAPAAVKAQDGGQQAAKVEPPSAAAEAGDGGEEPTEVTAAAKAHGEGEKAAKVEEMGEQQQPRVPEPPRPALLQSLSCPATCQRYLHPPGMGSPPCTAPWGAAGAAVAGSQGTLISSQALGTWPHPAPPGLAGLPHWVPAFTLHWGTPGCPAVGSPGWAAPPSHPSPPLWADDVPPPPAPFAHRIVTLRSASVSSQFNLSSKDILGGGKFGEVHTCTEKQTGLKLAAKVIRKQGAKDKEMVLLEIDVMNQLNHHNLIQLYDAIETPREIILFMEFVEGGELFERIIDDDYHLTEVDCMVFVRQICEGIRFMHHMHVLHLDLKPENILCVTATGHMVKIIDFGLARRYNPQEKLKVNFGTPEFLSPEVVNYEQVSYSTDMWSMGVITYMLLSGLSPFLGDNDTETLNNVLAANWYFDEETFESVSEEAKDFVSNLIIKEKSARMSAGQCLQHPWLNNLAEKAKRCNRRLKSQVLLKKYVMRRRWKKNFIGVCAANRFKKITSSGSLTALGV